MVVCARLQIECCRIESLIESTFAIPKTRSEANNCSMTSGPLLRVFNIIVPGGRQRCGRAWLGQACTRSSQRTPIPLLCLVTISRFPLRETMFAKTVSEVVSDARPDAKAFGMPAVSLTISRRWSPNVCLIANYLISYHDAEIPKKLRSELISSS